VIEFEKQLSNESGKRMLEPALTVMNLDQQGHKHNAELKETAKANNIHMTEDHHCPHSHCYDE
jgi:hypothetical protein